jgi:hypothetical protein
MVTALSSTPRLSRSVITGRPHQQGASTPADLGQHMPEQLAPGGSISSGTTSAVDSCCAPDEAVDTTLC